MKWIGSTSQLIGEAKKAFPGVGAIVKQARSLVPYSKREIAEWEAFALCCIARECNAQGVQFLEIGTCSGYSAALIALSAPDAHLTTLEPMAYAKEAGARLRSLSNVGVFRATSTDYLKFFEAYQGPPLSFIFVDGDHKRVMRDLVGWNHLREGGLFLFHDYNPPWAKVRPNRPVWGAVNLFMGYLNLEFDVYLRNPASNVHMVGFRRQGPEEWNGVNL